MSTQWNSAPSTPVADYISRNSMWLRPAAGAFIAIAAPAVAAAVDPKLAAAIPAWIVPVASVVGPAAVGLAASMTDTTSAAILRVVGLAAALGMLLLYAFR